MVKTNYTVNGRTDYRFAVPHLNLKAQANQLRSVTDESIDMNDREGCIILNLLSGIGYARFDALCSKFGTPFRYF